MNTATDHAARTRFGGRHPRSVIVIRVLAAAWLLALTGVLPSQPTHLNSDRVDRGRARLLIRRGTSL
jgi:hypothetical protein